MESLGRENVEENQQITQDIVNWMYLDNISD